MDGRGGLPWQGLLLDFRELKNNNSLNIPAEIYALLVSSLLRNLSSKIKNILRFES